MSKTADWIIGDPLALGLDPRVAAGTPEDIVKVKRSYTGAFLRPVLARARRPREGTGAEAAE